MSASLVGSEMCIRDRVNPVRSHEQELARNATRPARRCRLLDRTCTVSYTHLTLPTMCSV
eukprot:3975115-Alexandrium_andersonii.AAC.1